MAQLITNIPAYAFPHELNRLEFRAETGEKEMHLTISTAGDNIIETNLYFDTEGKIAIDDLASLLRDHIVGPTIVEIEFSTLSGANIAECLCLTCNINLHTTAEVFCKRNFLTRAKTRRVTKRSIIPITLLPSGDTLLRYRLVTFELEEVVNLDWEEVPISTKSFGLWVFELNIQEFLGKYPYIPIEDILYIEVEAGARKMKLEPIPLIRGGVEVEFVNAFGVVEQALFDNLSTEKNPERKVTVEAGRRRVYHVMNVATTTITADLIPDEERPLYEDCILALSHWLADTKRSIVVSDAKMKDNSDASNTASVEIKFQTSSFAVEADAPRRIFDKTFDNTFN